MFIYETNKLYKQNGDGPFEGIVLSSNNGKPAAAGDTVVFLANDNNEILIMDDFVVGDGSESPLPQIISVDYNKVLIDPDGVATVKVTLTEGDYADVQIEQISGNEGIFDFEIKSNGVVEIYGTGDGEGKGVFEFSIEIDGVKYSTNVDVTVKYIYYFDSEYNPLDLSYPTPGTNQVSILDEYGDPIQPGDPIYSNFSLIEYDYDNAFDAEYDPSTGIVTITPTKNANYEGSVSLQPIGYAPFTAYGSQTVLDITIKGGAQ